MAISRQTSTDVNVCILHYRGVKFAYCDVGNEIYRILSHDAAPDMLSGIKKNVNVMLDFFRLLTAYAKDKKFLIIRNL